MLKQELPPANSPIGELAQYWVDNVQEIAKFASWHYLAKRRLTEAVKDGGPIVTLAGRLSLGGGTFDYPDEVVNEFPGLGSHIVNVEVDTLEQAERVISLVTEEVPTCEVDHKLKVDGRAATALVRQGGSAAHRLLELREPKGVKLVVG